MRADPPSRSIQFAITLTIHPSFHQHEASIQYDLLVDTVRSLWLDYKPRLTLVAELTKSYDIHFHGIIDFEYVPNVNYTKYLYDCLRQQRRKKRLGFPCFKPVEQFDVWKDYILKDLKHTKQSLNRPPILCDQHNLAPTGEFLIYNIE